MALEEYIRQVRELWTSYPLDLVNYQNKCRLIRCVFYLNNLPFAYTPLEDGMIFSQNVARTLTRLQQ